MEWLKIERLFTKELAWPGHHPETAEDLSLFLGNCRTFWPDTTGDEYMKLKRYVSNTLGQFQR